MHCIVCKQACNDAHHYKPVLSRAVINQFMSSVGTLQTTWRDMVAQFGVRVACSRRDQTRFKSGGEQPNGVRLNKSIE